MNIRIIAIAKDECAYLSEWVHHHFYFGVDSIHIAVNATNDPSLSLLECLSKLYPVSYSVEDDLARSTGSGFQAAAYEKMAAQAKEEGFSHVLMLDIDEFWTPLDFKSSIKNAMRQIGQSDVYLFHWFFHQSESEFSRCFQSEISIHQNPQFKCLFSLDSPYERIGIHNVYGSKLSYKTADGQSYSFRKSDSHRAQLDRNTMLRPMPFVVLHRLYRSQMEYVSLLLRGRARGGKIKDNRTGYYVNKANTEILEIDKNRLQDYYQSYDEFIRNTGIQDLILDGQEYVKGRYQNALALFRSELSFQDTKVLHNALRNISLPEVREIQDRLRGDPRIIEEEKQVHLDKLKKAVIFLNSVGQKKYARKLLIVLISIASSKKKTLFYWVTYLPSLLGKLSQYNENKGQHIDVIRNAALFFERIKDYYRALALMSIAYDLRPEGKLIEKKVALYRSMVSQAQSTDS